MSRERRIERQEGAINLYVCGIYEKVRWFELGQIWIITCLQYQTTRLQKSCHLLDLRCQTHLRLTWSCRHLAMAPLQVWRRASSCKMGIYLVHLYRMITYASLASRSASDSPASSSESDGFACLNIRHEDRARGCRSWWTEMILFITVGRVGWGR